MRASILLPVLALVLVAAISLGAQPQPAYSIQIAPQNSTVSVGAEVRVNVILTNTSSHPITVTRGKRRDQAETNGYGVEVLDSQGNQPTLTKWGRVIIKHEEAIQGSAMFFSLNPGETEKAEVIVTGLYELAPGKYTVQVSRFDQESKTVVKSNTITVTVTK